MSADERQTLAVTIGPSPTVLGESVDATVTITGELDRRVRGAKAQLVRTAVHRTGDVGSWGGRGRTLDTISSAEAVIVEAPIVFAGGKVVPGRQVVSLLVPEDGLPSATGQVRWTLRAIIERRLGADVQAEAPVEVLAGPERFASEATAEASYVGEKCIDIELSTPTLRPGQTISGKVLLRPARAMTVTNVAISFVVTTPVNDGLDGKPVKSRVKQGLEGKVVAV